MLKVLGKLAQAVTGKWVSDYVRVEQSYNTEEGPTIIGIAGKKLRCD